MAALRGVSLSVEAGELAAVIGPSGSGKTTLLNVVSGLDRPTSGEVRVCGQPLAALRGDAAAHFRRRHIGFVFQFFNLIPTMTAYDNVAVPLLVDGVPRAERTRRVGKVLAVVGLAGHEARPAGELSGGEMQRVAIARAMVMEPALILADEPTGNLDSTTGEAILDLLRAQVTAGRSVVMVTHSYRAAAGADRVLVMRDGEIVEELGPGDLEPHLHLAAPARGGRQAE
jgi:putative ABC transport system ATP-binding protein